MQPAMALPAERPLVVYLRNQGWLKGAGPNWYYPANGYPHLHAGLLGDGTLDFLAYSHRPNDLPSIQLVRDRFYIPGSLPLAEAAVAVERPAAAATLSEQADLLVNNWARLR